MGQIIPRSMLVPKEVTAKLVSLKNELIALAASETKTDQSEWVTRDILPLTDLTFATEQWVNQHLFIAANAFERDWPLFTLPVNKYLMLYGVICHAGNPTIYGIKFKQGATGATTIDTIHFRKILEEDNVIGFFDRIIYRAQTRPFVEYIADAITAQFAEEFEVLGMVCEKYGDVVSGPRTIV